MHCKNLLVDDSSDWQAVETVCKGLPQFDIVPAFTYFVDESFQKWVARPQYYWVSLTFVVEPVDSVNTRTFMVPSEDEKVFGIFDFVREEETDCLQGLFTPINIVA